MIDNWGYNLEQLKIMLPRLMSFWDFNKVEKGLLRQTLYLQSQWMNFKHLNGFWELRKSCITFIERIFQFLSQ